MGWGDTAAAKVISSMFQPNATCDECGVMVELVGATALDANDKAGDDTHQHRSGIGPVWQTGNGNT